MRPTLAIVAALGLAALPVACQEQKLEPGPCGNNIQNQFEQCDNGVLNNDTIPDACRTNCRRAFCGDRVIDTGEECDSDRLAGMGCSDFGFNAGALICDFTDCTFSTRHCTSCGDGLAEGGEACDGADLGGNSCEGLGFISGQLGCLAGCAFDVAQCIGGCGNGTIEGSEACDRGDLGNQSCIGFGFGGGQLICTETCELDLSGCSGGCGNGILDLGEACDDGNDNPDDGCHECRTGTGMFTATLGRPTSSVPVALRLADVNNDGDNDIVVGYAGVGFGNGGVAVHLGQGLGNFGLPLETPLGGRVTGIVVGDFNEDTLLDVVATYLGDPNAGNDPDGIVIALGNGDGTFTMTTTLATGTRPVAIETGLFDIGTTLDLAVLNLVSASVVILAGSGTGTFTQSHSALAIGWPASLTTGLIDGNGSPDIIVGRHTSNSLGVYLGQGDGTFGNSISSFAQARPVGIATGKVDSDDETDVIVSLPDAGDIAFMAGDGTGDLALPLRTTVGGSPSHLVGVRLNEDENIDVAVADDEADTVRVFLGDGAGLFPTEVVTIPVGDSPSALRAKDMNGDGILDLVTTCALSDEVWLLVGQEYVP